MGVESTHAEVKFPLMGLVRWIVAPVLSVVLLATVIGFVRGDMQFVQAGALAFVTVFVGLVMGMMILAQSPPRVPGAWAGVLLISQGARMIVSLSLGLVTYVLAEPDPMSFWLLFLAASLVVLGGEVAFVMKWIRTADTKAEREER